MKILFIGYSNVFKNRIIEAVNSIQEFSEIHIAKFENQLWDDQFLKIENKKIIKYDNYEDAFNNANVDIVYISTINSTHYELAKKSLNKGFHTIVDKPITLSLIEILDLINIAKQNNLLLSESLVYLYHSQYKNIDNLMLENNSVIKSITASFSIPPLDQNNFRYKKELGGGAINDMGIYASSIGRYFFNEVPLNINSHISDGNFSILMNYSKGQTILGYFGFETEYVNNLNIICDNMKIKIEPAFTAPFNKNTFSDIHMNNNYIKIENIVTNNFLEYFNDIINCIKSKKYDRFFDSMMLDHKTLNKLKHNKIKI